MTDHDRNRDWTAGGERVPAWRDGVLLSRQQVALLTPEQLQQYLDDGVVRDLAEIEQMPEPMRSWATRGRASSRSGSGSGRRAGAPLSLMTSLVTDS